ncbi:N-6 DNA methylase [Dolichospermum circinale]|uniref:N-6 DNA methylase n=1 Tax=Dolichospermum circinale TaxID=109265 RepID=UPI002330B24C|nr:N-6 DNA methylase [Dolichospermum circinale]MDB9467386.1 N-6 DNA methylase [Dolichospermum circinale CS-539/09]MDB9470485.1 N-6 DNA methylase [Dolichospermum circinale CS-539]
MAVRGLDNVIEIAHRVWGIEPHRHVRIPSANSNEQPIPVDALWTDYGLRPNSNNLSFMVQSVHESEINAWKQRLRYWPIRAGLLVSDEIYILQYYTPSGLEERIIDRDSLYLELTRQDSHLFKPKALAEFRTGQLTLADIEESVSERSFSFLLRQRAELDQAFQNAIQGVLAEIGIPKRRNPKNQISSRHEIAGHGIRVAIAFLAARILEDKGFFGSESRIPTDDPRLLLNLTVPRANGFFKKALEESIPHLSDRILQHLGANLGSRVSFALVDHRDVGLLYERAIKELPSDIEGGQWTDLQRHYTPIAIAEKMLELLPLERLRPEERIIFDPAAGSGSLLLAATSRLAGMIDIPENLEKRKSYLANHVAGNDLDQYADLVTQLRYTLARESLGQDIPFPFPEHFTHENYNDLNKQNMLIKPRIIVANPPFAEDGNTQLAAKFIEKALSWLEKGSQFAFVLPQSFLSSTTHGIPDARKLLTKNCQLFEVWQFPEKAIGIDAEQAVCIVLGQIDKPKIIIPSAARSVFSRAKDTVSNIRNNAFLGTTWISQLNSDNWKFFTAPPISIQIPTIHLGNLFFVFNGVTPSKNYKPVSQCPPNTECKLNWRMKWRDTNRLWSDPERVREEDRWIRYGKEFLHTAVLNNSHLFDSPKIFVGRKVNRGSLYPLAAQLDTTGLCPDNNIFCVLPAQQAGKSPQLPDNQKFVQEWNQLTYEDQRLWLLGILSSKIANSLSLIGRKTHEITSNELCKLLLPQKIDPRIIKITRQIIERDQKHLDIPEPDNLRIQLDEIVEESYGNPHWIEIKRTGEPPELELWKSEQTKPTFTVRGQVLEVSKDNSQIRLYLSGLLDDNREDWLPILPEMPGWALDGTVFKAELSQDVETFEELAQRPWAIRQFRHTPRPYLTDDELREELGIEE